MDGWVYPWADGHGYGLDWMGREWYGTILLLCLLIFDISCSNHALIRLYLRSSLVFLPRHLPNVVFCSEGFRTYCGCNTADPKRGYANITASTASTCSINADTTDLMSNRRVSLERNYLEWDAVAPPSGRLFDTTRYQSVYVGSAMLCEYCAIASRNLGRLSGHVKLVPHLGEEEIGPHRLV